MWHLTHDAIEVMPFYKGIVRILYQWIQPNFIYPCSLDKGEFNLLLSLVVTTVMCASEEWDLGP